MQKEEPETWAASVPPGVASALKPHEAKRQEHIYEFVMTEKHHCHLLKVIIIIIIINIVIIIIIIIKVMEKVFMEGMVVYVGVKQDTIDKIFPQLDELIRLRFEFLRQLRERQVNFLNFPIFSYPHVKNV